MPFRQVGYAITRGSTVLPFVPALVAPFPVTSLAAPHEQFEWLDGSHLPGGATAVTSAAGCSLEVPIDAAGQVDGPFLSIVRTGVVAWARCDGRVAVANAEDRSRLTAELAGLSPTLSLMATAGFTHEEIGAWTSGARPRDGNLEQVCDWTFGEAKGYAYACAVGRTARAGDAKMLVADVLAAARTVPISDPPPPDPALAALLPGKRLTLADGWVEVALSPDGRASSDADDGSHATGTWRLVGRSLALRWETGTKSWAALVQSGAYSQVYNLQITAEGATKADGIDFTQRTE